MLPTMMQLIINIIILLHDVMRFPFYNARYSISCSMIFIHCFVDDKEFVAYTKNVRHVRMSFKLSYAKIKRKLLIEMLF